MTDGISVRTARAEDAAALAVLDSAAWSSLSGFPSTLAGAGPAGSRPFFTEANPPEDHLVAEDGGTVVGYLRLRPETDLLENAHVIAVHGLAVAAEARGRGVATALLVGAERVAREKAASKISLRVLATNAPARRLYEKQGYVLEGTLTDEFRIDGRFVDDLVLAKHLT